MNPLAAAWQGRGRMRTLCGHDIFTVDIASEGPVAHPPLLVLHGFPSSSFDFHRVADRLAVDRRVVLFDMLGYGLSDKPDRVYLISQQADIAMALVSELRFGSVGMLTHDMGDTVGGELLARSLEGTWDIEISDRTLTNGSIYLGLAHLSDGQRFLLGLPDEKLLDSSPIDGAAVSAGVTATFSPGSPVDRDEVAAMTDMVTHLDGHLLLPRTIRYLEERRRNEGRYTGAIESHPSALSVIWGDDDPIAVVAMTDRLRAARPDLTLQVLAGVGHYPMVESPDRFCVAVLDPPD
jgi:pimeloyl-ACP methyl ester carboxylesterase